MFTEYITKLQNLSEKNKKLIFFPIIFMSALVMLFFAVQSTKHNVARIQDSLKTISLPKIDFGTQVADIPKIDFGSILEGNSAPSQGAAGLTYQNSKHAFSLHYPENWILDNQHTTDDQINMYRNTVEGQSAGFHIEAISSTQDITSVQQGMEAMMGNMQEILVEKREITVGSFSGQEVIGRLSYAPFSMIYFSDGKNVFEIQYGEASKQGWKPEVADWRYYDEFLSIISTFNK